MSRRKKVAARTITQAEADAAEARLREDIQDRVLGMMWRAGHTIEHMRALVNSMRKCAHGEADVTVDDLVRVSMFYGKRVSIQATPLDGLGRR